MIKLSLTEKMKRGISRDPGLPIVKYTLAKTENVEFLDTRLCILQQKCDKLYDSRKRMLDDLNYARDHYLINLNSCHAVKIQFNGKKTTFQCTRRISKNLLCVDHQGRKGDKNNFRPGFSPLENFNFKDYIYNSKLNDNFKKCSVLNTEIKQTKRYRINYLMAITYI